MVFNSHKWSILQLYLGNLANKLPGGGGEIYTLLVFLTSINALRMDRARSGNFIHAKYCNQYQDIALAMFNSSHADPGLMWAESSI